MLEIYRVDESQARPAPEPENFTGRVRMQNIAAQGGAEKLEMLAVFFDTGAHTRPHKHPSEQVLQVVQGNGFVQLAGEERQPLPLGSIAVIPGGVVHMHGATDDEPMCHIALRAADGPTDWGPADTPEEWRALLASESHG